MTDQPDALPEGFAETLRELKKNRDPRFTATLIAANRAGWPQWMLGQALGYAFHPQRGSGRIHQFMQVGPGGYDPVPDIPPGPMADHLLRRLPPASDEKLLARQAAAREAAEDKARKREKREARTQYLALCRQRFLTPLPDPVPAKDDGKSWYRCTKCKKKILRNATNPQAHRCY